jgi:hypothetical protein
VQLPDELQQQGLTAHCRLLMQVRMCCCDMCVYVCVFGGGGGGC